jgi:hypothetical protein
MVVVGNQAREDSQDGELEVDDQKLGNQAVKGKQPAGLRKKKNLRAALMRRTVCEMASRMTSKKKRRQELRSPSALLAWGHLALVSRQGSSS